MPYTITKNKSGNYKVVLKRTGQVLAYDTKYPLKLIAAISINNHRRR